MKTFKTLFLCVALLSFALASLSLAKGTGEDSDVTGSRTGGAAGNNSSTTSTTSNNSGSGQSAQEQIDKKLLEAIRVNTLETLNQAKKITYNTKNTADNTDAIKEHTSALKKMEEASRNLAKNMAQLKELDTYANLISGKGTTNQYSTNGITYDPKTGKYSGVDLEKQVESMWVGSDGMIATALVPPRVVYPVNHSDTIAALKALWTKVQGEAETQSMIIEMVDAVMSLQQLPTAVLVGGVIPESVAKLRADRRKQLKDQLDSKFQGQELIVGGDNAVARAIDKLDPYYASLPLIDFCLLEGAGAYHPMVGTVQGVDLDAVSAATSAGFSGVMTDYNNYARRVVPGLEEMARRGQIKIGDIPTAEQLATAQKLTGEVKTEWASKVSSIDMVAFYTSNGANPSVTKADFVHSVGLPIVTEKALMDTFMLAKADLIQNYQQTRKYDVMLAYTKEVLKSQQDLMKATQALAKNQSVTHDKSAIGEMTLLIRDVTQDVVATQKVIAQLEKVIQGLYAKRNAKLEDVLNTKDSALQNLRSSAKSRTDFIEQKANTTRISSQAN